VGVAAAADHCWYANLVFLRYSDISFINWGVDRATTIHDFMPYLVTRTGSEFSPRVLSNITS